MRPYLKTKDFSVTGEDFQLLYDKDLDLLVTEPQPKELEIYYRSENYISHTDSKDTFMDRVYHTVKQFNLWLKTNMIHKYGAERKTLLDFGAGTGDFLITAKGKGWSVAGVEPNPDARMRSREKRMELYQSINDLGDSKFQVITLWHVLEHVPDLENQIELLKKHLEEDGIMLVAVPNYKSYDASYYKEFWAAFDTPRHLWHFSRSSIHKIFSKHSMKVINTKPMWFDAFYVALLSEKYKNGRQRLFPALAVGLLSNIKALINKEFSSLIYIIQNDTLSGRKD
ncbi:class I SAM-dependent methyltransferase [Pareuzebyella sediminis]|uniref:class I SAM-dependent methyltransferase n=1 Tax=Pareuzebyella sediminis TaxID=2607998 RepID=UPI0011EE2044|nr:class I SAM-dependent methyltransferase [Pareuzebyella sediminis]